MDRKGVFVVVALFVASWLVGLPLGLVLVGLLVWDAQIIVEWNEKKPRRIATQLDSDSLLELHPLRVQAIADLARQIDATENTTMFKFVASCKKMSYETLKALCLVDLDSKTLTKHLQLPPMEQQVRRDFLRNIAKKLTHPLFGITPSTREKEEKYRGFEIVDWLATNFGLQRKHAVELGQAMQAAGMIFPLKRLKAAPGKRVLFGDKMRHWRFDFAAIDKDWPAQRDKMKRGKTPSHSGANEEPAPKEAAEEEATVLMGPREWNYLFASGTTERYVEGHEIVSAGACNENLYRITQGMVKISEVDKKKKVLSEDSIFGEESASFLTGSSVSRISVVAHTAVTVQLIDSVSLAKLLLIEPQICKSFFRWLAASVSDSEKSSSSFVSSPSSFNMIGNQADPELAASSRFSMYFPEWATNGPIVTAAIGKQTGSKLSAARARLSSLTMMGGGGGTEPDSTASSSALLIKHFRVRWLNSKSQLFVTPKGVAVVSTVYKSLFKQLIPFDQIQSVDQLVQPNRRNGFDFGMTIGFVKHDKTKTKRKELSLLFEDSESLRAACELVDHLRKTIPSSNSSEDWAHQNASLSLNPFGDLDITPEDWQRVLERSSTKTFAKGLCVVASGAPVMSLLQIVSGQVRVVNEGAAVETAFTSLGEGDFIGDFEFAVMRPFLFTYLAETDVECLSLDVEHLRVLFVQDALFAARLFRFLAAGKNK